MFTVYIKDMGLWTKALRNTAMGAEMTGNASSLLVDVDGFYSQVQSLTSMKAPRVVIVAGGSGMTSLMGFIQVSSGTTLFLCCFALFIWCCGSRLPVRRCCTHGVFFVLFMLRRLMVAEFSPF